MAVGVEEDLAELRAFDRTTVLNAIEEQLSHQPGVPTKRRKVLVGLIPPWHAVPPVWQLSVGDVRVFYDVDEEKKKMVAVRAVRRKPPHATTEEIL